MIKNSDIRRIVKNRLGDSETLYRAMRYDGSYYLCGYVIELGLKYRICKTLGWAGYPSTSAEFQGYNSFKTHNLDILLRLSGIETTIKSKTFTEWGIVRLWNVIMKDMKDTVVKLLSIEKEVSKDRGPFNLFALFLREGYNQWDLLVSSEWIDKEKYESLKYIASKIQTKLEKEELLDISGMQIIDHNSPELEHIYRAASTTINIEHSIAEVTNCCFFGFIIHHGYIMASKKPVKKILA